MYQFQSRIRYSETDPKGNLTIVGLINYLQDASTFHSGEIGYGLTYLMEHHWGWFITDWELHIHTLPRFADEITVRTWPVQFKGMFAYRNFVIENAEGECLVEAKSLWLLMDLTCVRPVRIPEEMAAAYGAEEALAGEWHGRKIALMDGVRETEPAYAIEVMPVHLDTNGHMNNAYYIEIARDMLPKGKKVYTIRTEYKKSAQLGDTLLVRCQLREHLAQVVLEAENGVVFAVVEFGVD